MVYIKALIVAAVCLISAILQLSAAHVLTKVPISCKPETQICNSSKRNISMTNATAIVTTPKPSFTSSNTTATITTSTLSPTTTKKTILKSDKKDKNLSKNNKKPVQFVKGSIGNKTMDNVKNKTSTALKEDKHTNEICPFIGVNKGFSLLNFVQSRAAANCTQIGQIDKQEKKLLAKDLPCPKSNYAARVVPVYIWRKMGIASCKFRGKH